MSNSRSTTWRTWRRPLLEATLISIVVLGLFYYWFGIADRYAVFLYGHTTTNIPPAQPFDATTSNRYWMAGLVAAGAVMVLYVTANGLHGRICVRRQKPCTTATWWQVWAGYRYISTASNFFAFNVGIQILALIVAAGLAVGVTSVRRRLGRHQQT